MAAAFNGINVVQLANEALWQQTPADGEWMIDYVLRTNLRTRMTGEQPRARFDIMTEYNTRKTMQNAFDTIDWATLDEDDFFGKVALYIASFTPDGTNTWYNSKLAVHQEKITAQMFSELASSGNVRMYNFAQATFLDYKIAEGLSLDSYPITSFDECPLESGATTLGVQALTTALALVAAALAF